MEEVKQSMRIAVVEPFKYPYLKEIEPDQKGSYLSALQAEVGGWIEPFDVLYGTEPSIYVNENFLFDGSQPNRAIYATAEMEKAGYLSQFDYAHVAKAGECYDIVNGTFVAVGLDPESGESRSVTDEEFQKVMATFGNVESLFSGRKEIFNVLAKSAFERDDPFSGRDISRVMSPEVRVSFKMLGFDITLPVPLRSGDGYLFEFTGATDLGGYEIPHYLTIADEALSSPEAMAKMVGFEARNFDSLLADLEGTAISQTDWHDLNLYSRRLALLEDALMFAAIFGDGSIPAGPGDGGGPGQRQRERVPEHERDPSPFYDILNPPRESPCQASDDGNRSPLDDIPNCPAPPEFRDPTPLKIWDPMPPTAVRGPDK